MKRYGILAILATIFVAFIFSLSYAQPKPQSDIRPPGGAEKLQKPAKPSGILIPDLEARLTIGTRRIEGTYGIMELKASICNIGTADYVSPPAVPAIAQLMAYDPTKPLTRENIKTLASPNITRLNKGACTHFPPILHRIPNFISWDIRDVGRGECIAILEFSLSVSPNVPEPTAFKPSEDSNSANNVVKRKVRFKIRCP